MNASSLLSREGSGATAERTPLPSWEREGPAAQRWDGEGVWLRARAKELRAKQTDTGCALWAQLRAGRLLGHKFKRQVPLGRYIVDFINFDGRLIVEVDGGQHANSVADQERDAWLRAQGFRVLRVWNSDVLANLPGVLEAILFALRAPPLPNPSPARGEGPDCGPLDA